MKVEFQTRTGIKTYSTKVITFTRIDTLRFKDSKGITRNLPISQALFVYE